VTQRHRRLTSNLAFCSVTLWDLHIELDHPFWIPQQRHLSDSHTHSSFTTSIMHVFSTKPTTKLIRSEHYQIPDKRAKILQIRSTVRKHNR
jgi:hypothetical protein